MQWFNRVQSRVCIIRFSKPSIAPLTEEEQTDFDTLDDMILEGGLSKAIGFAIAAGKVLQDKTKFKEMRASLRSYFQGREINNWTNLALCLKEVATHAFSLEIASLHLLTVASSVSI